jgi:Cu-processing system permease protein
MKTLWILTRKELRDALRNRWFLLYAASFALLATALSYAALLGSGQYGFANFGRTAASLINLVLLVVPLMGLTAGAQSLVGEKERGTLAYMLAQPVSRLQVFAAKFLGQILALGGAMAGGFAFTATLLAARSDGGDALVLARLMGLALLLCGASLALGMLLSAWMRTSAAALGAAVFLWLFLAFGVDVALLGGAVSGRLELDALFSATLFNPLAVFRMACVLAMRSSLEILGPAGMYAVRTWGDMLAPLFVGVLALWTLLPLAAAYKLFRRADAV